MTHAILAALQEDPCSGYDLTKRFDGSVGFFWQASHQQIYRELTRLEKEGLLEFTLIQQSHRPDKKIYRLTEAGYTALKHWIRDPAAVSPIRDELLVKTFAGHLVDWPTFESLLQQQRGQHLRQLAIYHQIEQDFFTDPQSVAREYLFQYATLRYGIRCEESWLAWCDEVITMLTPQGSIERSGDSAEEDLEGGLNASAGGYQEATGASPDPLPKGSNGHKEGAV
ncbi:MAG: PadR family transcriptional regulator [Cyanophyceae cyanobacterium]